MRTIGPIIVLGVAAALAGCSSRNPDPGPDDGEPRQVPIDEVQAATWLVVSSSDFARFTASAIAVEDDLLVTSGYVAEAIRAVHGQPNARTVAYPHDSAAARPVTELWPHPGFDPAAPPLSAADLALLGLEAASGEPAIPTLEPASNDAVRGLAVLDAVVLCGYPSSVVAGLDFGSGARPQASCVEGQLSALRPFDATQTATPANSLLLQYRLADIEGLWGGPLVDEQGRLIAVHSGTAQSGEDLGFGTRADALARLLEDRAAGELASVVLADIEPVRCATSYYNETWSFGFDLPEGFLGPVVQSSPAFLFGAAFAREDDEQEEAPSVLQVRIYPATIGFEDFITVYQTALINSGIEILQSDPLTTPMGGPGHFLWYRGSSAGADDFAVEVWVTGSAGFYNLAGFTRISELRDDSELLEQTVRSLCADVAGPVTAVSP